MAPTRTHTTRRPVAFALFRFNARLHYQCGRRRWDIEDATVERRLKGPVYSLTFQNGGEVVGACRWLDWELARRWFVPAGVDFSRRHRIGRSEASLNT